MAAPLEGLRVLELARILAGPWVGQTLADLGADVIKVESPSGDDTRRWGPPFMEKADGSPGDAAYFHSCNRGKRSITFDFNDATDKEHLYELIKRSDILIENFKTGGLAKYGLDYKSLHAIHPRLIYCSITGFGQNGPYAKRPGYDFLIQGMSGIMDLTGEKDGGPQKIGVALADIITGLYSVIAIQAALAQREKTGHGQHIDMALFDSMSAVLANQSMNFLVSGIAPKRLGNAHPNIVPYQVFPTCDGHIIITIGNDQQMARLFTVLSLEKLMNDSRFQSNADRVSHRDELIDILTEKTVQFHCDELLLLLEEQGIPVGPINTVGDVFSDPQIIARNLKQDLPANWAKGGCVPTVRSPIRFSDATLHLHRPAPQLGEHNDEILKELQSKEQWQKMGEEEVEQEEI